MAWPWIACAIGLALGAVMGLLLIVRPRGSHLSIGLGSIPERSGGVGESRAFGGLLLGVHAAPLGWAVGRGGLDTRVLAALSTLLAVGWLCAFLGRLLSVAVDREGLPLNARLLALDALMTALIGAPWLVGLIAPALP